MGKAAVLKSMLYGGLGLAGWAGPAEFAANQWMTSVRVLRHAF